MYLSRAEKLALEILKKKNKGSSKKEEAVHETLRYRGKLGGIQACEGAPFPQRPVPGVVANQKLFSQVQFREIRNEISFSFLLAMGHYSPAWVQNFNPSLAWPIQIQVRPGPT